MPFIKMTSFSSSTADADADAASFDYSGMAPRSTAAGNDTQKVGGTIDLHQRGGSVTAAHQPLRPIGELLPGLRGAGLFLSARQ